MTLANKNESDERVTETVQAQSSVLVDRRPEARKQVKAPIDDDDLTIDDILQLVRQALEDKKGQDVTILDVSEHCDYMEYIVVASGLSDTHNRALADNVMSELSSYGIIRDDLQGYRRGDWILIDYDVLVVHLFLPALREFYRLEELWASGEEIKAA